MSTNKFKEHDFINKVSRKLNVQIGLDSWAICSVGGGGGRGGQPIIWLGSGDTCPHLRSTNDIVF